MMEVHDVQAMMYMVDLAGSERVGKTEVPWVRLDLPKTIGLGLGSGLGLGFDI